MHDKTWTCICGWHSVQRERFLEVFLSSYWVTESCLFLMHCFLRAWRSHKSSIGCWLCRLRTEISLYSLSLLMILFTIDEEKFKICSITLRNILKSHCFAFLLLFQPYHQKEPPVVRVVEGPLFSEVVAHYQHFQQTIRIYNVPGSNYSKLLGGLSSNWLCPGFLCLKTPDGRIQQQPICLTKWQFRI